MANNNLKINEKISAPKLKKLLEEYKKAYDSGNSKSAVTKLNELANELVFNTKALTPVQLSAEPVDNGGALTVPAGSQVSFILITDSDKHYLPVFTDNSEMGDKLDGEKKHYMLTLDFSGISAIFENNTFCAGLIINPFSDNLLIQRQTIIKWSEDAQVTQHGHARHTITSDTPTEVYALNPYPMVMSNKLCEAAKSMPGVNALWLRGIKLNGDDGYLLIADLSEDGNNGIFKALGECATPMLNGKPLHIITTDTEFGKKNIENILPIYSKND